MQSSAMAAPKVAPPVAFLDLRKFLKHLARGAPLQPPHDLRGRHFRRTTHQYVHMVSTDYPFYDVDLEGLACLPHQLAYPSLDLFTQHLVAIPRHPHKV